MDLTVLMRVALLLVRPGMVVMLAPPFGGTQVPQMTKVGLTVMIAIGLLPSVAITATTVNGPITLVVAREAMIGLSIAFVLRALIAGAEFAGHLSGHQIGLSYGATVDPQSGVRNNMLATLYGMLATLGFLAINGHHAVLRALSASYAKLPIGVGHVDASLPVAVREIFALVFSLGMRLAAPIVAVLVTVELLVGLISRASPMLSSMVIGYPLKIIIGLFVLGLLVGTVPAVTNSMIESAVRIAGHLAAGFR